MKCSFSRILLSNLLDFETKLFINRQENKKQLPTIKSLRHRALKQKTLKVEAGPSKACASNVTCKEIMWVGSNFDFLTWTSVSPENQAFLSYVICLGSFWTSSAQSPPVLEIISRLVFSRNEVNLVLEKLSWFWTEWIMFYSM